MKRNIKRGPGRPMADITIPNKKFTFAELCEVNSHVTALTLRKFLKRDAARKGKSEVVLVKDETREPIAKKKANAGLGRKVFVYIRRSKATALKTARKSNVSVPLSTKTTADYEAQKAALLAPTPAPVADTTAPTPAPVTPANPVTA